MKCVTGSASSPAALSGLTASIYVSISGSEGVLASMAIPGRFQAQIVDNGVVFELSSQDQPTVFHLVTDS